MAFTRREIYKKKRWVRYRISSAIRSQTGTHMVACPFGNGSDKNGKDNLSFTLRDLPDLFHFLSVPFHFFRVEAQFCSHHFMDKY